MESTKGHCKHGEFNLLDGCPKCIAERRDTINKEAHVEAFERMAGSLGINMGTPTANGPLSIVKVKYYSATTGELSSREYTYFAEEELALGDVVMVPVKDRIGKATVTTVNVPESEIEPFRDKVKTIPKGSRVPQADNIQGHLVVDEKASKESGTLVGDIVPNPGPYGNQEFPPGVAEPDNTIATPEELEEPAVITRAIPVGMALVKVSTDDDLAVKQLYQEGLRLKHYADALVISANTDLKGVTNDLSLIAKLKKTLEEKRKEYVDPIRNHLAQVNAAFVEFLAPFESADQITRGKVKAFREDQNRKAAEAQAIEAEKRALAEREMKLKGETTVDLGTTQAPPPVPDRVRTDLGTQGFQKVHKWKVVDLALVPAEYKTIDAAKVQAVVKASKGTIIIPGIEIWTEEAVRINTK